MPFHRSLKLIFQLMPPSIWGEKLQGKKQKEKKSAVL